MYRLIWTFVVRISAPNTHFPMGCLIYMYLYVYIVCLATFSGKKVSIPMIEQCSLVLSRFHCRKWLNTSREGIETPVFQKHIRSDLGPYASSVDTGTCPEQIAIIEMFSKFRKFPDCACLQSANSPKDIIE